MLLVKSHREAPALSEAVPSRSRYGTVDVVSRHNLLTWNTPNMKYILYRPTDQTGLGNRLRGLTLCYAISLVTGRRLLVDDYLITEYFRAPPGQDWTVESGLHRRQPSWLVLQLKLSPENWDSDAYNAYSSRDLNEFLQEEVVEIAQGASFIEALIGNPNYRDRWIALGLDPDRPLEWIGRLVERLLARPKAKLLHAVERLKRELHWDSAEGARVGVQYRTFFDIGSPHLPAVPAFIDALRLHLPATGSRRWFFLTTDESAATDSIGAFLENLGEVHTVERRKTIHTGYTYRGWSEFLFKVVRKVWPAIRPDRFDLWRLLPESLRERPQSKVFAEWYLLGECDHLISTFTTFAEFAAARRGNVAELIRFDPDARTSIILKEQTKVPLVTVITVSYNSLAGLKETLSSLPQDPEIESLVVDGASTDGSVEYLQTEGSRRSNIVSEPDCGIFHAMNKGILKANGSYILFLNCGDRFDVLLDWVELKRKLRESVAVHVGGLEIDGGGKMVVGDHQLVPGALFEMSLPHQAAFIPRGYFLEYGLYNEAYALSADQEWFLRTLRRGASYRALNRTIARYQGNGVSARPENLDRLTIERATYLRGHFGHWLPATRLAYLIQKQWHGQVRRAKKLLGFGSD